MAHNHGGKETMCPERREGKFYLYTACHKNVANGKSPCNVAAFL